MKKFKINKFEKFVIRYRKPLFIGFWIFTFFIALIIPSTEENMWIKNIIMLIPVIIICPPLISVMIKEFTLLSAFRKQLDLKSCIEGINSFIDMTSPKDTAIMSGLCNNRIAFLIALGEIEKAEEEIKLFWQSFDLKKLPARVLFSIHLNYAEIKLMQKDEKGYNEQLRLINTYQSKCKKGEIKYSLTDALLLLPLEAEATFGNFTEDFESRVFEVLNTVNGKPRKKTPDALHYLTTYEILFNYFKRFNLPDKAKYYAEMIMKIGNEQFLAYREAREYLEKQSV